jgi:hypothetical protein
MVTGRTYFLMELIGGLVKGAKIRALYVGEVSGSNPWASHFGSMVVTSSILGWKILYVAVVARYGGALSYIFFDFSVTSPPWAFRGCLMAPANWPTWSFISPPRQSRTGHMTPSG